MLIFNKNEYLFNHQTTIKASLRIGNPRELNCTLFNRGTPSFLTNNTNKAGSGTGYRQFYWRNETASLFTLLNGSSYA